MATGDRAVGDGRCRVHHTVLSGGLRSRLAWHLARCDVPCARQRIAAVAGHDTCGDGGGERVDVLASPTACVAVGNNSRRGHVDLRGRLCRPRCRRDARRHGRRGAGGHGCGPRPTWKRSLDIGLGRCGVADRRPAVGPPQSATLATLPVYTSSGRVMANIVGPVVPVAQTATSAAGYSAVGCCAVADSNDPRCPKCGTTGHPVGAAPVRPHAPQAIDGPWGYCPNGSCPVVFFLDHDTIDDDQCISQVGTKAASKPRPVCFCFSHTPTDIAADLARHGRSTIGESVTTAVAYGLCACEHLNPTGKCCLPAIRRALQAGVAGAHA